MHLNALAPLFRLSRRTLSVIHANVAIALGLKLGFMLAAIFGVTALWMAVLADSGASVLVTLNSLRLLTSNSETLKL